MVKNEEVYQELESIVGSKNISTKDTDRIAYGRDAFQLKIMEYRLSSILSQPLPDYVVWVESVEQIQNIMRLANEKKIPIIPYGGGAGANGGVVPLTGGISLDLKKLRRIEIHEEANYVLCQAGVLGQHLENFLNRKGYTLGHLPSSLTTSTIGGFVATRSAGALSSLYGSFENMVLDLEVVLPNGEVIHTNRSRVPRKATGPNFNEFFIGSEGTLGIVTDICLKIKRNPTIREFAGFLFPTLTTGLQTVRKIMNLGIRPSIVRLYEAVEARIVYHIEEIANEQSYLTLAFDGYEETKELIEDQKRICSNICLNAGAKDMGDEGGKIWFKNRLNMYYPNPDWATAGILADTMDVITTYDKLENLFYKMKEAMQNKKVRVMAHWSHFYTEGGSMYLIFVMLEKNTEKDPKASKLYQETWNKGLQTCIDNGGSISHHHGIGLHGDFMEQELGPGTYQLLKGIKDYLDPNGIMNPGKLGL